MHELVGLGDPGLVRQPAMADAFIHLDDPQSEIMDEGHAVYEFLEFFDGYLGHGNCVACSPSCGIGRSVDAKADDNQNTAVCPLLYGPAADPGDADRPAITFRPLSRAIRAA